MQPPDAFLTAQQKAAMATLGPRWYPLRQHPVQLRLWNDDYRFKVVPAGRRSGKTENAKRRIVNCAIRSNRYGNARFFAAAPTWAQAKRIFWADLKAMVPKWLLAGAPSEGELTIRLNTGSEICVFGMDKPERIEGSPWDGGVLDEYANMKEQAWGAHVRPALSDRRGWCWLTGVPEGRNHYYDIYKRAQADTTGEWGHYTWKSSEVLPLSEIEAARKDLDELTFLQEYEASFVNFLGQAYYSFDDKIHCAPLTYRPDDLIVFCFDFNVAPGIAAICQEQHLPSGQYGTGVIGEVHIPQHSNTVRVCNRLIQDWGHHRGKILCYGDASGGAGGSAKVAGSDWDLVRKTLKEKFGDRLDFRVPSANPSERARINAVNTRLKSISGEVRLMVDPRFAPNVVIDFEGVRLVKGGSGEIDKKATPKLTHVTDAIGYYVFYEFPVIKQTATQATIIGV